MVSKYYQYCMSFFRVRTRTPPTVAFWIELASLGYCFNLKGGFREVSHSRGEQLPRQKLLSLQASLASYETLYATYNCATRWWLLEPTACNRNLTAIGRLITTQSAWSTLYRASHSNWPDHSWITDMFLHKCMYRHYSTALDAHALF